jgi:transcriptional regulator with GAF, ATPase, and Fis domain
MNTATNAATPLSGRLVTIGTSTQSDIRLRTAGGASHVAHLLFTAGLYRVQIVEPRAAVRLNGKRLSAPTTLTHGDTLSFEEEHFVYLDHAQQSAPPGAEEPPAGPVGELVRVTVALLKNHDHDPAPDMVASVSRLLRCDAVRLVVEDALSAERTTLVRYPQHSGLDRFSSRAIDWAHDAGKTVMFQTAELSDALESSNSLARNAIATVLCAPLMHGDAPLGYLYLDRVNGADSFTEQDRQFCDTLLPLFTEILVNARQHQRQRETIERLQKNRQDERGGMVFQSECMQSLIQLATRLARTDSPVLILGETGTGKELMARFMHDNSSRAAKPLRAINCGAIPENLIESELFGHEKGAFTGASNRKIGLFEAADGGTVFLDELGELPLSLQVKLLRVLQEGEVLRVGSTEPVSINVRIVAATHRNLDQAVAQGTFRQDLYYRLNVLTLTLPPLRQRGQDIIVLAELFLVRYCEQFGLKRKTLGASAQAALLAHQWPGNVRELENVIQKAALLSMGTRIEAIDIQTGSATPSTPGSAGGLEDAQCTLKDARAHAEHDVIVRTLSRTAGNVSQASKLLDIDRKWLMKKMEELGVAADDFRH